MTVNQAKQIKIEDLYEGQLRKIGNVLRGRCPIHNDTGNPNFTIYLNTNTFYCFACGKGGDSIKFVMLTRNISFTTALEVMK